MKRAELEVLFNTLAKSQGFYGRLLASLEGNDEAWEHLEAQNFKDAVDVVMFIEA